MSANTLRPALTAAQVAEALSMNPTSVYRLFDRKHHPLPHIRTGDNAVRVQAATFDQWLREEEQLSTERKTTPAHTRPNKRKARRD